jgi:hypothetical protein
MTCPLCGARKARRTCPALGRDICAVCCGTKRLVEIRCPADCSWLKASLAHPPAAVLRQRERDRAFMGPLLHGLPPRGVNLFVVLQDVIQRQRTGSIPAPVDADVVEAARTLAATLETAGRGIIYEHQATSIPAQRLVGALRTALDELANATSQGSALEREAALVLRRIEAAASQATKELGGDQAFLDLLGRIAAQGSATPEESSRDAAETTAVGGPGSPADGPRIIIP